MKQPLIHSLALGAQVVEKSQTLPKDQDWYGTRGVP